MSATLLAGVTGLALLDALNPATIAGVALLLLAPLAHPVRAAAGFVAGAYLTVLGLGALMYVAAGNGLVQLYERLGSEKKQPRSVPIAAGYLVAAAGVLTVAVLS